MIFDIYTLRIVSVAVYGVFLLLLLILVHRNRDLGGWRFMLAFAFLIFAEALLSIDVEMRRAPGIVYFGNALTIFAYLCLLIGCLRFSDVKYPKPLAYIGVVVVLILSFIGYVETIPSEFRIYGSICFIIVMLLLSIFVLLRWSGGMLQMEKYNMVMWVSLHLAAYVFRIDTLLSFDEPALAYYDGFTLFLLIISTALVMIGVHLLVSSRRYVQLEEEILARKKAELKVVEALELAENANKTQARFLASMSHELRTPLNAIMGFSETIQREICGPINEKQREYLGFVYDGGEVLLRLINDLLNYSSLGSAEVVLRPSRVNFGDLVAQTLPIIESKAKDKQVIITNSVPTATMDIMIDPIRVKQILINLLSNAIKYGNEGGKVWIDCEKQVEGLLFTIRDDGPGVSKSLHANLFQPFNRGGKEGLAIEGAGLGLSISKILVEAMGGEIGLESDIGQGATFWVKLRDMAD